MLSRLGVGRLVVVGAQTDMCIRSTLHGAFVRGYDAILVSDGHTTEDQTAWGAPPPDQVIAHTNLYWTHQIGPGRTGGTVTPYATVPRLSAQAHGTAVFATLAVLGTPHYSNVEVTAASADGIEVRWTDGVLTRIAFHPPTATLNRG